MDKQYIHIRKWADNWHVLNSPTPDFEVAGTITAASIVMELPDSFDKQVTLQDLIEAYDFDHEYA